MVPAWKERNNGSYGESTIVARTRSLSRGAVDRTSEWSAEEKEKLALFEPSRAAAAKKCKPLQNENNQSERASADRLDWKYLSMIRITRSLARSLAGAVNSAGAS